MLFIEVIVRKIVPENKIFMEYAFFISNSNFRVRPSVANDFSKSRPKVACNGGGLVKCLKVFKFKTVNKHFFALFNNLSNVMHGRGIF